MNVPIKHFYMIRHGQSEANAAKILAGHTDSPLT
ncbi:MAG: histidine phosphatase family protein, partial [Micavibrio sp.]|nr:histidine phosphatase family protein [Micavibrio sp.]